MTFLNNIRILILIKSALSCSSYPNGLIMNVLW